MTVNTNTIEIITEEGPFCEIRQYVARPACDCEQLKARIAEFQNIIVKHNQLWFKLATLLQQSHLTVSLVPPEDVVNTFITLWDKYIATMSRAWNEQPVLIESLDELQTENAALKSENEALSRYIMTLEKGKP